MKVKILQFYTTKILQFYSSNLQIYFSFTSPYFSFVIYLFEYFPLTLSQSFVQVLFFPIHLLCLEIIHQHQLGTKGIMDGSIAPVIMASITLFLNFVCLLALQFHTRVIINTDHLHFFATKTSVIFYTDMISKLMLPWIVIFQCETQFGKPIMIIGSLMICAIRDGLLFHYLPFYNFNYQRIQTMVSGVVTSCILASSITRFLEIIDFSQHTFSEYFLIWSILGPTVTKLYHGSLKALIIKIFCNPKAQTFYHKLHWFEAFKHLTVNNYRIRPRRHIFHENTLWFGMMVKQFENMNIIGDEISEARYDYSQVQNQILGQRRELIQNSFRTINNHPFLKLMQTMHYAKYEESLPRTILMAEDGVKKVFGLSYNTSFYLIKLLLQDQLHQQNLSDQAINLEEQQLQQLQSTKTGDLTEDLLDKKYQRLNMLPYFKARDFRDAIRNKIIDQLDAQSKFWESFVSLDCDFGQLLKVANDREQRRKEAEYFWKKFTKLQNHSQSTTLFIYGTYLSLGNNLMNEGQALMDQYFESQKERRFLDKGLCEETIFDPQNIEIKINGTKAKQNKIQDCSHSVEQAFGITKEQAIGKEVTDLMPPFYRDKHRSGITRYIESGISSSIDTTRQVFGMNSGGYCFPIWLHVKINPILNKGLSFISIIRPISDSFRYVLVYQNGVIDSISQNFANDLGMEDYEPGTQRIENLSAQFALVNDAFNKVINQRLKKENPEEDFAPKININFDSYLSVTPKVSASMEKINLNQISSMDIEDAEEIYKKFKTGQKVNLRSSDHTMNTPIRLSYARQYTNNEKYGLVDNYDYELTVEEEVFRNQYIKVFKLQKLIPNDDDEDNKEFRSDEGNLETNFKVQRTQTGSRSDRFSKPNKIQSAHQPMRKKKIMDEYDDFSQGYMHVSSLKESRSDFVHKSSNESSLNSSSQQRKKSAKASASRFSRNSMKIRDQKAKSLSPTKRRKNPGSNPLISEIRSKSKSPLNKSNFDTRQYSGKSGFSFATVSSQENLLSVSRLLSRRHTNNHNNFLGSNIERRRSSVQLEIIKSERSHGEEDDDDEMQNLGSLPKNTGSSNTYQVGDQKFTFQFTSHLGGGSTGIAGNQDPTGSQHIPIPSNSSVSQSSNKSEDDEFDSLMQEGVEEFNQQESERVESKEVVPASPIQNANNRRRKLSEINIIKLPSGNKKDRNRGNDDDYDIDGGDGDGDDANNNSRTKLRSKNSDISILNRFQSRGI